MNNKEVDKLFEVLKKKGDPFIFLTKDGVRLCVMNHGSASDLMHLLQMEYREIKKMLEKEYGEVGAKMLLSDIPMTDEEMEEEVKNGIPSLKKFLEELEDDDADDESDDCYDESSEEDCPCAKKAQTKKALDNLADALRDAGIANVRFVDIDDADRRKNRG